MPEIKLTDKDRKWIRKNVEQVKGDYDPDLMVTLTKLYLTHGPKALLTDLFAMSLAANLIAGKEFSDPLVSAHNSTASWLNKKIKELQKTSKVGTESKKGVRDDTGDKRRSGGKKGNKTHKKTS